MSSCLMELPQRRGRRRGVGTAIHSLAGMHRHIKLDLEERLKFEKVKHALSTGTQE